eukprot:scaffold253343_cov19-Prasinocladus_malaysianus.AAC.1
MSCKQGINRVCRGLVEWPTRHGSLDSLSGMPEDDSSRRGLYFMQSVLCPINVAINDTTDAPSRD